MKKILVAFLLLLSAGVAHAGTVNIAWNPNPPKDAVTGYNVYIDKVKSKTVLATETTASLTNVTPGAHEIYVTAYNAWSESLPSNSVFTPGIASPPTGLVVTVMVQVGVNGGTTP